MNPIGGRAHAHTQPRHANRSNPMPFFVWKHRLPLDGAVQPFPTKYETRRADEVVCTSVHDPQGVLPARASVSPWRRRTRQGEAFGPQRETHQASSARPRNAGRAARSLTDGGDLMYLRGVGLFFCVLGQLACSSRSAPSPAPAQDPPAACVDYAAQVNKCVRGDRARVDRALGWIQPTPADPDAAAQQEQICTREAARLRAACK
jgi:hypothetical protein